MTSPHTFDREEVMAYLDGELPPARAAVVRVHVEACESCRALAADLRAVSARLVEWPVEPAPGVLDVTVRAALDAAPLAGRFDEGHRRSRWQSFLVLPMVRFAGAAAVISAGLFGMWLVARPFFNERDAGPAMSGAAPPSQALPAPQMARTEPDKPSTPDPVFRSAAQPRDEPSRPAANAQGGLAARPERLQQDAVSEVRLDAAAPPVVPSEPPPPALTKPPLTTVPAPLAPPPPPPAAVATPLPAMTETVSTTALGQGQQGQAGSARASGIGRGGRGATTDVTTQRSVAGGLPFLPGVGPQVARRVDMAIVSSRFDTIRADLDRIVAEQKGMTSALTVSPEGTTPRAIETAIRIPVERIQPALAALRALGRVTRDVEAGDDLAPQVSALVAKRQTAVKQEAALQDLLARQAGDRQTVATTQQAIVQAREDRDRLDREIREFQVRVTNVFVTLRIEER